MALSSSTKLSLCSFFLSSSRNAPAKFFSVSPKANDSPLSTDPGYWTCFETCSNRAAPDIVSRFFIPSAISGIWALHTAPHSSRVHHCAVYFQRPTKSDPQPFNEAKLRVCLSRHAGDDIPLDIHSLRDHGDLTTLSESCKVLDSMVIEVNAGQKGGKIFLPFELTSNWQAMMNETTLDISQWTVEGTNTVRCIQLTDETADVFILRASSMPSGNQSNTDVRLSQSNPYANLQLSYPSVLGTDVITSLATAKFPPVDPQMHLPENDEDFLRRCEEEERSGVPRLNFRV
ncbi:hypothetical protein EDD18DRAFT_1114230 [Armillaria luteobubalina]|uniref:Uncharacterized protein n=1 Tax=Armillaria luteobubalina TaxID=153913 RepID=A0AA39U9G9_9AGAR|nr:hypothetical protein EDD18DRAFT_1114230 [Armillaria luteobubalina]